MKRVILMVAFVATSAIIAHAQAFEKGTNVVSVGIGLGSSILNYSGASQMPAINVQYEKGVFPAGKTGVISLGGYLGYKSYKYSGSEEDFKWSEKWNYTVIGVRSAYHYTGLQNKKIDPYGGVMLSYNLLSYSYSNNSGEDIASGKGNYGSNAGFTAYVGARYYFSPKVAAMAELGYGVSYLTLGASFKF